MTEARGSDVRAAYVDTGAPKCPICQMPMNGSVECHLPSCTLRVLQEADVEARVQAASVEMRERCAKVCEDELRKIAADQKGLPEIPALTAGEVYGFSRSATKILALPIPTNAYDAALLRARIEGAEEAARYIDCGCDDETDEKDLCYSHAYIQKHKRQLAALTQPAPEMNK